MTFMVEVNCTDVLSFLGIKKALYFTVGDLFNDSYGVYMRKKKRQLPYYFTFIAWILCFLVIIGCSMVIVLYGMQFGNKTSLEWLATVSLTAVEDFFLFQPLQVLVIALLFASSSHMLKNHLKRANDIQSAVKQIIGVLPTIVVPGKCEQSSEGSNSEDLLKQNDPKKETSPYAGFENLVNPLELEKAKQQLEKHRAMKSVLIEVLVHVLFASALFVKVFSAHADWGFSQRKDIQELLRLKVRPKFNYTAHNGTVFEKVIVQLLLIVRSTFSKI